VRVSVIIPSLNEAAVIAAAIQSAAGAEVIVSDGGSTDGTIDVARRHGARVIEGESMRARQMNAAVSEATGDALIFLHADTVLPAGALEAVGNALDTGTVFGGFRIAFLEPGLEGIARAINTRTKWTRAPWGDQAQFIRRSTFLEAKGFQEMPIMEDYELARRMKRAGRTTILPLAVRTSGRRFLDKGFVRTAVTNWTIIAAYHLGISPQRLANWYRG
jgi:rSAM/selenodomain-associated transferase 2